ncbi:MAG: type II toxin-antitoxin system VapC family toxin [Vicinamibacterales bacterium]
MRAVDTNVLVRLITRDDARQVAAADRFIARGAWVSHLAVAETTWVLASVYDCDAAAIATAVEMLLSHEHLTVQDTEVVAAAVAQYRQQPRVGFSDCLMVEVARKAGHQPLGTFDRSLGKIDGAQRL